MTDCECTGPGFCERHKVKKNAHWVYLCKTRPKYFQAWEDGRGPGQRKGSGKSQPKEDKDAILEILRRIRVCERCPQYMRNRRCKAVDLGCQNALCKLVRGGECPEGRWYIETNQGASELV